MVFAALVQSIVCARTVAVREVTERDGMGWVGMICTDQGRMGWAYITSTEGEYRKLN